MAEILNSIAGKDPTPDFAVQVAEEASLLMEQLADEGLKRIAHLKMAGYRNAEISNMLGCGLRTVERKLTLIRRIWTEPGDKRLE